MEVRGDGESGEAREKLERAAKEMWRSDVQGEEMEKRKRGREDNEI